MTHTERIERTFFDYPFVSGGKGSDTANQQRQQELNMQQQAFDAQQAQLRMLNSALSPALSGTQGYDPAMLAALQTQFLNQNDQAYNGAGSNLRSALLARGAGGGNLPASGDFIRGTLGLESAKANTQAQGLNTIGLQNLQQALSNKWNAANVLSGNAATQGGTIGSTGSAASSALNSYIQAANSGFGNAFTTALGGSLGKGLGAAATGGISGGLGMLPGLGQVF